ncbi:hypothetical protein Q5794_19070 [Priestia megaterium]|uniref:hypothetical protein n=1 Tax=Priestia megaterium TaxID=1404 RepID=UPI0035BE858C
MSKQIKDRKEIKLLDSQIYLCDEIRKLLKKKEKRSLAFEQEYTEHDILHKTLSFILSIGWMA